MRRLSKKWGKKIDLDPIFFFDSRTAPAHTKSSLRVGVALISKQKLSEESAFQAPQHNKFVVNRR